MSDKIVKIESEKIEFEGKTFDTLDELAEHLKVILSIKWKTEGILEDLKVEFYH